MTIAAGPGTPEFEDYVRRVDAIAITRAVAAWPTSNLLEVWMTGDCLAPGRDALVGAIKRELDARVGPRRCCYYDPWHLKPPYATACPSCQVPL